MKIRNLALAAIAVACGQAHALDPATSNAASTVKVYLSGATAMRNIIGGLFTENCVAGTLDVYYSGVGTFSSFPFAAAGDAHRVYTCTMAAASPILPNKNVALFKSDIGGSGQGVFPVYLRSQRGFLDLTSCGTRAGTVPNYTCAGEQQKVPMAGVSDVEPGMFTGVNVPKDDPSYPPGGLSSAQISDLDVRPLFQTIFAVAVNKALRDAMQSAQGILPVGDAGAEPTMSRTAAGSFFTGALTSPASGLGWQSLVKTTDVLKDSQVNICRRVDGSGTQASANAFFLTFPCNNNALALADKSFSDVGPDDQALSNVVSTGNVFIYEGSTTGNVISCLNAADTNGAYAIGHVSKENVPNAVATATNPVGNWRHVKLDGVSPNRDNTKGGQYDYFFESTMQWNKLEFATLSTDQKGFLTAFAARARLPSSLAKLSSSAQNGVAATPGTYAGAYGTGTADEIKFGSRVSRGGNSCVPPTFAK